MRPTRVATLSGRLNPGLPHQKPLAGLTEFTTGQAARILGVAPRSVTKWFDAGELKGYRIPGSEDRRIPCKNLVKFMLDAGMTHRLDLHGFVHAPVAVGVEVAVPGSPPAGWSRRRCDYATGLLAAATEEGVRLVLIDAGVGLASAREFAAAVRDRRPLRPPVMVYLAAADLWPATTPTGFDAVLTEPADPAAFWALAEAAVPQ